MTQQKQPPIKTFHAGGIRARISVNETETEDGTVIKHSVRVEKRYFHRYEANVTHNA